MHFKKTAIAAILLASSCNLMASAQEEKPKKEPVILNGVVSYVVDGDRFILQGDDQQYFVRMKWIDAPNEGQALNEDARSFLSDLIQGREVTVISENGDVNGCYYGEVVADIQNYNIEMLSAGYAHVLSGAPKDYIKTAVQAKNENRGVWNENTRVERGSAYLTGVDYSSMCNFEDTAIIDYKTEESLNEGREHDRYLQVIINIVIGGFIGFILSKTLHSFDDPRIAIALRRKKALKENKKKGESNEK